MPAYSETGTSLNDRFWAEFYLDASYRKTNFSADRERDQDNYFARAKNYYITDGQLTLGLNYDLDRHFSFDPYLVLAFVNDWGHKGWNDVYWDNNLLWGLGLSVGYEYADTGTKRKPLRFHYVRVDAFSEYLRADDSFDGAKEQLPSHLSLDNFRAGFVSWMSVGTRTFFDRFLSIWGEMWSEFAYETTNFSDKGQDDYYILQLAPLTGLYADFGRFSVQPYYKLDFRRDFGGRTWNKEPWLNRSKYGPGIRIPIEQIIKMDYASIYLFAEYMDIKYHSRVSDEKLKDWASYDYRTGIQLWIPLWPRPK
jgi:hypothetical protein